MPFAAKGAEFSADTPERILGEDGGRAYRNFLDWTAGDGFALAILEITEPRRRNQLLAWTAHQLPEMRVVEMDRASGKPLRPLLEEACGPPGEPALLVLTRLEEAADRRVLFARLNVQRDELARAYAIPWVILIHPVAALEMTMHAPDFVHFAGLWLREEGEQAAARLAEMAISAQSEMLSSVMVGTREESELLARADNTLTMGEFNEAADLLAQLDLRDPAGSESDGYRLYLQGRLAWGRGNPEAALAKFDAARKAVEAQRDERRLAIIALSVAIIRMDQGYLDEALRIFREQALPAFERHEDSHGQAFTKCRIANVLERRGQLDEALRIYRDEALPLFEKLGDVRDQASTNIDIADILTLRGQLDEALRIYRDKVLPVFERLGDVRAQAILLDCIAELLALRGQPDEALRIHREEALPVFEQLGDVRSRASAMAGIANILMRRGELDEALRIHREEVIPVLERSGAMHPLLAARTNLAIGLLKRGNPEDQAEAKTLLTSALADAERLQLPETAQIKTLLHNAGDKTPESK